MTTKVSASRTHKATLVKVRLESKRSHTKRKERRWKEGKLFPSSSIAGKLATVVAAIMHGFGKSYGILFQAVNSGIQSCSVICSQIKKKVSFVN